MNELVFLGYAGLSLISALLAITRRELAGARRWLMIALLLAGAALLHLEAPLVAAAWIAGLAVGAPLCLGRGSTSASGGGLRHALWSTLALGFVLFVLLGTVARQYVWYGARLPEGVAFGGPTALAEELTRRGEALLIVGPLLAFTVVCVAVATSERRGAGSL